MSKVILLTKNILKRMLHNPVGMIIRTFVLTALFFLFLLIFNIEGDERIHIGVADQDHTVASGHIVQLLKGFDNIEVYEMEKDTLDYYVHNGDLPIGMVIPKGFEEGLLDLSNGPIDILTAYNIDSFKWIDAVLSREMVYLSEKVQESDQDDYRRTLIKRRTESTAIVQVEDLYHNNNSLSRAFGVYLLLIMLSTMTISFQIVDEKNNGTFERIGFSPVKSMKMTIANIVANMLIVTSQLMLLLVMIKVLPWWVYNGSYSLLFLILFVFGICAVAFGILIASFSKSTSHANALMSVLLTPTCMIGGCLWPINRMPDFMQRLAYLTPQRWTLDAIAASIKGRMVETIAPSLAVVMCFTVLFGLIASRQFIKEK